MAVFDLQNEISQVSISQSTKHRVTLFPLCSALPAFLALSRAFIEQMRCKITKIF